ncbi:MAG: ABC transporter ATP-binding protein, partial [Candidatus Omnitrophica bacterium]|nr:ABC transporter ATP-binding protein [Candidatus Omnitrophota bacterium]
MKEYFRLLRFIRPHLGLFIVAAIAMGFSALFDGVSLSMMVPLADKVLTNKQIIIPAKLPDFVANFINLVNATPPGKLLNIMAWAVLVLFLLKGFFAFLQSYLMSDIGQRVSRDVRSMLYKKMQGLSLDYFTQKRSGELVSRITNDVRLIENSLSYGLTDLIYQGFQVILFTFLIFFIYPKLAFVAFIMLPLISMPIVGLSKILRKLSKKSQEKIADVTSILSETIFGNRIVKAFSMEDYEVERFNKSNDEYYKVLMKSIKRTLISGPATEFIGAIAGVFVFVYTGREVINGTLSFGVFGLFIGSMLSLIRPFKKLSQVNALNQQALAASARIYEVLDRQPSVVEKPGAAQLSQIKNEVAFENVRFSYTDQIVLDGISFKVKTGEVTAIVGPSGTGKSTLIDLIPRFYDPQEGKILIDGKDIRGFTFNSLRGQIGIVTQETILFNDTVKANIAYGRPQTSLEDIRKAAKLSYADDFISKMPEGYDTVIGDRGLKLSGGEKQRIAIARALLKNPPILILDEATSQLDTESERIVQQAIDRLIQGRTVFIVAHRLSTVRMAHQILVLDKGKIVEKGTHEELLKKNGLYSRLYQIQESTRAGILPPA